MHKKWIILLVAVVLVALTFGIYSTATAAGSTPGDSPDNPIQVASPADVPSGAHQTSLVHHECNTTQTWTLTVPGTEETSHQEFRFKRDVPAQPEVTHVVHHDAVTHVVHHDAVTHTVHIIDVEAVPAVWANWEPNNTQGPQDYTPIWPTDERGHWTLHSQGIPPGQEGPDGVYQQGSGNSPWFYRHAAVLEVSHDEVVVDQQAYDETVVDQEAYDETVVDQEATDGYTEYYVLGGEPSLNEADASWILAEQAPEGWTQFDERTVSNGDGTEDVNTYYAYDDGKKCSPPPTPPVPPVNPPQHNTPQPAPPVAPAVPTVVEAGL